MGSRIAYSNFYEMSDRQLILSSIHNQTNSVIFVLMLDQHKRDIVRGDFEKYMRYILENKRPFDLETLVSFASSLVNFYLGSKVIVEKEKADAATYIVLLFNGGLSQKISDEDIAKLKDLILDDNSLDYANLAPIFS